jgi:hypothetical protein
MNLLDSAALGNVSNHNLIRWGSGRRCERGDRQPDEFRARKRRPAHSEITCPRH